MSEREKEQEQEWEYVQVSLHYLLDCEEVFKLNKETLEELEQQVRKRYDKEVALGCTHAEGLTMWSYQGAKALNGIYRLFFSSQDKHNRLFHLDLPEQVFSEFTLNRPQDYIQGRTTYKDLPARTEIALFGTYRNNKFTLKLYLSTLVRKDLWEQHLIRINSPRRGEERCENEEGCHR